MKNKLSHFAIHVDDIEQAKNFDDGVFDWGFNSYGQVDKPTKMSHATMYRLQNTKLFVFDISFIDLIN